MQFQIRLATADDMPALDQLMRKSIRALSVGYYSERQIEIALNSVFGIDKQLIADRTYFVMEVSDSSESERRIAGCGGWSKRETLYGIDPNKQDDESLLNPATDAARIRAFFVDPDFARQGIGRRIMKACESAATEAGFTRLELGATLPGVPLYSAMGYQPIETIEHPLPEGEVLPVVRTGKRLS